MEHCLRPVRAERYITMLFARSLQASKVQHHTRIASQATSQRRGYRTPSLPTPETPSAPNCPVRQAGTTKVGLQQRQTCRRGTHIPYTISTPHSQLHICLFLFFVFCLNNPVQSPLPSSPPARFPSLLLLLLLFNTACHSLQARASAVTTATSCFDNSPSSPQQTYPSSSLHLSPNQNTHFHLATPTISFTKTRLYQRRPLTDNSHQQLERYPDIIALDLTKHQNAFSSRHGRSHYSAVRPTHIISLACLCRSYFS